MLTGILLLDKPLGLSSNSALQRVKRLLRAEKAGHVGSLDRKFHVYYDRGHNLLSNFCDRCPK